MGNFHHDVLEHLARDDALYGTWGIIDCLRRAVSHHEVALIGVHCSAKIVETFHSVHRQRCFIRIGDRLVWFDENNAFSDTRDNLLKL
jgi:hypothetical protein